VRGGEIRAVCRQDQLLTCALRPAAIYGPGETRHFPRIMRSVRWGLLQFRIGSPSAKVDWVHVDNLVYAHLLAMAALLNPKTRSVPALASSRTLAEGSEGRRRGWRPQNLCTRQEAGVLHLRW